MNAVSKLVLFFVGVGLILFFVVYQKTTIRDFWSPSGEKTRSLASEPLVFNVLEKSVYYDCHIPGSEHLDVMDIDRVVRAVPKERQIIIYCNNYLCTMSDYVAQKLRAAGFNNVRVYAGGMAEWFQQGMPVEGIGKAAYLTKKVEASQPENSSDVITLQELAELLKVHKKEGVDGN